MSDTYTVAPLDRSQPDRRFKILENAIKFAGEQAAQAFCTPIWTVWKNKDAEILFVNDQGEVVRTYAPVER